MIFGKSDQGVALNASVLHFQWYDINLIIQFYKMQLGIGK